MKSIRLLALLLLTSPAWAGTWSFAHGLRSAACTTSSTSCSLTISAVAGGTNDVVAIFLGTAGATATPITSATLGSDNFTLVAASGCSIRPSTTSATADCAYLINPTAGGTSVTVNVGSAPNVLWSITAVELTNTVAIAYDTAGTSGLTTAGTSATGPTLTLTGSNDGIIHFVRAASGSVTAIGGGYTECLGGFSGVYNNAYLINTASGTAPVWTQSSVKTAMNAIAFKETGGGGVVRHKAMVINQ